MSLSKKNLDKLNNFKRNKILNDESNNLINYAKINKIDNSSKKRINSEDPNNIFYSLIDNSESLDETSKVNHSLRNSEIHQININARNSNYSNKLSTEEELYDEFNYLLDD